MKPSASLLVARFPGRTPVESDISTTRAAPISKFGMMVATLFRLLFGGQLNREEIEFSLSGAAISLSCVPVILRFGFRIPVIIGFFTLLPLVQVLRGFGQNFDIPHAHSYVIGLAIVAIATGWFFTFRVLATSHPWRAGVLRLPGQARRA
jgi:hypothetical protein